MRVHSVLAASIGQRVNRVRSMCEFDCSFNEMLTPRVHRHFDFISSRRQGSVYVRKNYTISEYPEDLKPKIYLLKHFEGYIMNRLYGEYDYTFEDTGRTKGMDFVQKYLRMKHVIVFKMSHDVLQVHGPTISCCGRSY